MKQSKAAKAFQRKLLIAWLIDTHPGNLGELQKRCGMPRRTLQDSIKDLDDIGIECEFIQQEQARNNQGFYQIRDWGPIKKEWIAANLDAICASLEIELNDSEI